MKRTLLLALCLSLSTAPAFAAPPKGKATPRPIPSEMPTFQDARIKFGLEFLKKGNFAQAEQEFRSATLIDPNSVNAAVGLADALYGRKNYTESLSEYMRAMRLLVEEMQRRALDLSEICQFDSESGNLASIQLKGDARLEGNKVVQVRKE